MSGTSRSNKLFDKFCRQLVGQKVSENISNYWQFLDLNIYYDRLRTTSVGIKLSDRQKPMQKPMQKKLQKMLNRSYNILIKAIPNALAGGIESCAVGPSRVTPLEVKM